MGLGCDLLGLPGCAPQDLGDMQGNGGMAPGGDLSLGLLVSAQGQLKTTSGTGELVPVTLWGTLSC